LSVPRVGRVEETGDSRVSCRVVDESGVEVAAVTEFLRDMAASDAPATTLRSYSFELLGWLRFLWAVTVPWDRATRTEARDYALWLGQDSQADTVETGRLAGPRGGQPNHTETLSGRDVRGEHSSGCRQGTPRRSEGLAR
jgi:hypothetical protein